jgi:flagellar biosynthesis/type III secretory pathway protein FliH
MNLLRTTARVIKGGGLATPAAPAPPPHSWPGNGTGYGSSPAHDVSDASLLLEEARAEAERLRDEAQAEGYAAGLAIAQDQLAREVERRARELASKLAAEQARELAEQEFGSLLANVGELVSALRRQQAELATRWEHELTLLAAQMAERLIGAELARRPQGVIPLVREAVALAAGLPQLVLRLHPDDLTLLTGPGHPRLVPSGCEVIPDPGLQRGGCVVELEGGEIDARIETRLARIVAELTGD